MSGKWVRVVLGVGAVVGLFLVVLGYRYFRERGARRELLVARAELEAGRPFSAIDRLKALETTWDGHGEVSYWLGMAEQDRGREDNALDAWERVPGDSPFSGRALVRRSRVEIQRGRLDPAETLLTSALALPGPHTAEARDALVRLLRSEGRFGEARRLTREGVDRNADLVTALRTLYRHDLDPFPVEGVRIYLENAAKRAPDDDRVWLGRAHLETRLGRYDEAKRWLDACARLRPDDPSVARALLDWALAADRPDEVLAAAAHVPFDDSTEGRAQEIRAWFAARRGDRVEEGHALEAWHALEPGRPQTVDRLAELAASAGDAARAARLRAEKTHIDQARGEYLALISSQDPARHARELARVAATLGRKFDSACWASLAAGIPPPAPTAMITARQTLAGLLADLAPGALAAPAARRVLPAFADDAIRAGLNFVQDNGQMLNRLIPPTSSSGGVGLLDFDGDGHLDVYCVQGGAFPPPPKTADVSTAGGDRLFRNRGDGTFEDATERSGIAAMARGYGHGVAVGDIDNDGDPDLFVTRWRSYALYRNRGDGTFEDATEPLGLGGDRDWPTSAAFADLDNDGRLDLYVCHYLKWDQNAPSACEDPDNPAIYRCNPSDFPPLPDHLFRNEGGRFTDVTREAGIDDRGGRGLGVVAADLDDDGKVDLYVANDQSANNLFHNLGGMRFAEVAMDSGAAANAGGSYQAGMGVACGDLDGDGLPDLAVTNYYNESTTFFRNLGKGLFADHTNAVGLAAPSRYLLGFGVSFLDADDDGHLDVLTANGHVTDGRPQFPFTMPMQLLLGSASGRLLDISARAGAPFQAHHLGRGLAVGDLDNDGRLDAVVVPQADPMIYLHNQTKGGHHLTIGLEGTTSNRDAVGARGTITAGGRRQVFWRLGGGSYQSAPDPRLHFGLGDAKAAERLEVRWPSGRVDSFDNLPADTSYHLREGDAAPKAITARPKP